MLILVFFLLVAVGVWFKVLTDAERTRLTTVAIEVAQQLKEASRRRPEDATFRDALKERHAWVLVSPAIASINVAIFLFIVFGPGSLSDPATLVAWGGSLGVRTTNGEWWRLLTSIFLNAGLFQLLIASCVVVQIGLVLERLVGRLTFLAAYLTAGCFASLVHLSSHSTTVGYGASGAVSGLYGLLLACLIWGRFHPSGVTIPFITAKRLIPAAVIFLLHSLINDSLTTAAEITGLTVGFVCGLGPVIGAVDLKPTTRRIGTVVGVALTIAVAAAIPLRGIADIRPELDRVIALEDKTSQVFTDADAQFKKRKISANALADRIEQTIIPEFDAAQARLNAIRKVPAEHQAFVSDAKEYLALRAQSWRLRADSLRRIERAASRKHAPTETSADLRLQAEADFRANLTASGNADGKTRASLEVLDRIKHATP